MTCAMLGTVPHWCDSHLGEMGCGICHARFPCSFSYLQHKEPGSCIKEKMQ